jgi:hypothetical protein
MTPENHPNSHEMQIAEDLDTFLTAQLAGESVSAPPSLSQSETDIAAMLVAVSDEVQPDSAFAAELETRLLGANVVDASGVFPNQKTEELPETQQNRSRFSPSLNVLIQGTRTMKLAVLRSRPIHRFSIAAMALLAISSVVVVSTPSLRSLAETIFEHFIRTSSDSITSTGRTPKVVSDTAKERRQIEQEFRNTKTVREMEKERGFDVKEPTYLPPGFVLQDVGSPYPNLVGLPYENPQTKALILIAQQRLDGEPLFGPIFFAPTGSTAKGKSVTWLWSKKPIISQQEPALQKPGKSPVGASAKIELIQIGNRTGQYVEGAWEAISHQEGSIDGMRWDPNPQARQIQWQEGDMLFQITTPSGVSRDELVAIARSMQ